MTPISPDDALPPILTLDELSKRAATECVRNLPKERPKKVSLRHAIQKHGPRFWEKEHK